MTPRPLRVLTPRPVRSSPADLVRAVTPPAHTYELPQRSPLPAYDPHDPELEPTTERLHRPRVEPRLGPGRGDCRVCWCPRETHTRGYGDTTGPCKRPGCQTGCTRYRPMWTWRDWANAAGLVVIGLACTGWITFLVAATVAGRP